ncbi:phosphoserine aminotransferase [Candidatus Photodesmus katoptron]|uniref:Phosphoserine aminotransferase n=1 Tax=Candidatus Photodesmus katoptron Akat1 TaxID=1236703 RepID=S3EHA9_9GAMM|nr:3-phosphoserine/phosphohydroxythreonine transaminase [Candidatus Photodesmus katoptron]EPE37573.1 phosphoserine aminotransferase [Candidatus Photodesmus katoptron Akat1]KEY90710.1 phosphoserine aminotransferase [Candidatus Photodesmus katoptron]
MKITSDKIFNFSSGPSSLPKETMKQAQAEFMNWNNLGISIMEINHRNNLFLQVAEEAEQLLRDLLNIPDTYKVLFSQGGARTQFSAVPLNLLGKRKKKATYIDTGYWSRSALEEAKKYCEIDCFKARIKKDNKIAIIFADEWNIDQESAYVHFCPNETVDGIEINDLPLTDKPIIADMSSTILSRGIDISKYGIIYAGAQKNIGPSGICISIVRDDLLDSASSLLPSTLNYRILAENKSIFNTPPTFSWYLSGLVFKWLKKLGGLKVIEKYNRKKAAILYDCIDKSMLYKNTIHVSNRSLMNVPFQLVRPELNIRFLQQAKLAGLLELKGHRSVGGMRASIYNAMPIEGVQALIAFMEKFEQENY